MEILLTWGLALYIQVFMDGVPVRCLVDTGAQSTFITESVAVRLGTLSPPLSFQTAIAANGSKFIGTLRSVRNVGTADLGWNEATLMVVPDAVLITPCILGTDLLAQQPIVIDWDAQRVRAAR